MVMFPAHILTVAMRTSSWGTEEIARKGSGGKPREMFRVMVFSKSGYGRGGTGVEEMKEE